MSSQEGLLRQDAFAEWRQLVVDARSEREVQKLRGEIKREKEASTKRMLTMMFESQAGSLKHHTFVGWSQCALATKAEKEVSELQAAMKATSAVQMLTMMT